jgi:lysine-N-methylase
MGMWADALLALERLDDEWTQRLLDLKKRWQSLDLAAFERAMAARQTEYEQFAVYLLYRHFVTAETEKQQAARAVFVTFGVMLLYYLGAVHFEKMGAFTFDDQVELARLFSSEIEYSDENLAFFLGT